MFNELTKYKNSGHFFFKKGDNLKMVSKNVPDKPGVYCIYKLSQGNIDLIYIGKSGTILKNGEFKSQTLRKRLNNKQDRISRQKYFEAKMETESIDALDIYWYVTYDEEFSDIPACVEAMLIQKYYDLFRELPPWNKYY